MLTRTLIVDRTAPEPSALAEAAAVLRRGGVVAFATETVYGLGANALDASAVGRIFEAKGRPSRNPIIVHVNSIAAARQLVTAWPRTAQVLAEHFWPGPLTLVLPKQSLIPDIVTAGGPTVAIRVPRHPLARALIEAAGVPLAAPSANVSNRISSTTAEHVRRTLDGRIELILDGGPAEGGLESTVVDVTQSPVRLLRPGLVSPEQLAEALGEPIFANSTAATGSSLAAALPSPGLLSRHYAPRVPLECVADDAARIAACLAAGERVGWLRLPASNTPAFDPNRVDTIDMPRDAPAYAAQLYAALYALEAASIDRIIVSRPPLEDPAWHAIQDRLARAQQPS